MSSPAAISASAAGSLHPFEPASIRPYVITTSPITEAAMPGGSRPGLSAVRDSGISATPTARPTMTTGMLIRNTQPHQNRDSIQPPRIGPSGSARKLAAS